MRGIAIDRMPEETMNRPHSETVQVYLSKKYSKYGFKREHPIEYNPQSKENGYRWVENVRDGLRFVGASHDIVRLDHTGWFNDNFRDETVHGEVYQLPARNGVCLYVPAINDPCNDNCALVDFTDVRGDKEEAARAADQMAERSAEESREYQAKEDAKNRLDEIADEIKQIYKDYRATIRQIRAGNDLMNVPVVRRLVIEEWHGVKRDVGRLRKQAAKIEREGMDYRY